MKYVYKQSTHVQVEQILFLKQVYHVWIETRKRIMKFVFTDGEKIGVYDNGKTVKYDSAYITRYRENTIRTEKNREWKRQSEAMMSDELYMGVGQNNEVTATLNAVSLTLEENKLLYAFSVNETAGIYYKYTEEEKDPEAHFLTSNEVSFLSLAMTDSGDILGTVQTDSVRANIAVFSRNGGDYKSLTDGDSFDENPSFDEHGNLLFNSYGVGRDANNVFITYTPSEILRLQMRTMEMETVRSNNEYSYIKPIADGKGNIYCIRKPSVEKREGNLLLDILLIPVRIVQAIIGFIATFVMCFAGKPMLGGRMGAGDGSMARNGKADPKKVFINKNLINVEKELKKNKKTEDFGFIPRSWKLVRLTVNKGDGGWDECELASGVADYCVLHEENGERTLVYTNGKHIFAFQDVANGKRKKVLDTDFCLKIGCLQKSFSSNLFEEENATAGDGLFDRL